MVVMDFIESFSAGSVTNSICPQFLGAAGLAFNPFKLILLIGWVYLCLYFVQRVQFSPLISSSFRSTASIITLFIGPLFLFVLLIIDTIKKAIGGDGDIFDVIKDQMASIFSSIKSPGFIGSKQDSGITLLDTSGRNIKEIYGRGRGKSKDTHTLDLTEQLVWDALDERASDILIDPKDETFYTVRFRVDGVLRVVEQIESDICQAVINSIKAVSNMDISERRRPQDGAFTAKTADGIASFRVASAGVMNGEKLSIRVLSQKAGMYILNNIGLSTKQQAIIKAAILKPSGMILMCGPTGSGKTTTLYAMLNEIDLYTRNVITVEDPIEAVLENASQIEINPRADITFAKSLRSILRQDPDVICVGEIRDEETAEIALRAAQTGHLVLATIHSNSSASALVRLLDLGVAPVLMASGLNLIVSQRLLRRLCSNCRVPAQPTQSQIIEFQKRKINYRNIFQAQGCDLCSGTGYLGRVAICDMLWLTNEIKTNISKNELLVTELRKSGDKKGHSNLYKQGLRKVVSGMTSFDELKRVVG